MAVLAGAAGVFVPAYAEESLDLVSETYSEISISDPNYQKDYGNSLGDSQKYYSWELGSSDQNEFREVEFGAKYNIKYDYSNESLHEAIDNSIDISSENINGVFMNIRGIMNRDNGIIGNINADFVGNTISPSPYLVQGSAIRNGGTINNISGNFIGNSLDGKVDTYGGAISNSAYINNIKGDFVGNHIKPAQYGGYGGAICNRFGTIASIKGNFIGNYTFSSQPDTYTFGGAIYNEGEITNITGNFVENYAANNVNIARGGAIANYRGNIDLISGNFIGNYSKAKINSYSGAIHNSEFTIKEICANFIANYSSAETQSANGGAMSVLNNSTISMISSRFKDNYAISKEDNAYGGSIYNNSNIEGILNSDFIGNYAKSSEGIAQGGAIYTTKDLNIIADNGTSTFKGNYTEVNGERDDNAIYADSAATINFKTVNGGRIDLYDNIRGVSVEVVGTDDEGSEITTTKNYSVNITGDSTGTFGLYNQLYDANVSIGNTNLDTVNNLINTYNFNTLTLIGNVDATLDVDLAGKAMDRFTAEKYGKHTGNLNVSGMNLLSDATDPKTEIYFAQEGLKDNVTTTVTEVAYTPIYKYNVRYENRDDAGYFVFDRGGSSSGGTNGGNPSDTFNPAVLSSPVSSVAAAQATINETFKYVFEHADAFTQMPYSQRMAQINSNKYAISTDFNGNRGSLCYDHNNKAAWFRPYATFETMNLKNGPKVNATTYGSLAGFDTDFHEHKNGWHSVGTGYIGYNGSQLSYKGVDTTMNGGILGYTHTMYKGNFWTALTLSAGASVGESRTMYGKEDFTSLMAGVGSKTGYNFEFKEGKYILQPIMFMSYTFVNTFDYTNAAGVKINADPAHSIQLNPSIRFISNFKNGWQPYASVGMVWNVMNENNVTANNVRLPEMSMKPYAEYGVGVQRNWKDKFTAFGQAMLRNGGRNGIALTAGFRWALGKGVNDKVQAPKTDRTVLKQLTPQQKMALTGKKNTTITSAKAVLKQL